MNAPGHPKAPPRSLAARLVVLALTLLMLEALLQLATAALPPIRSIFSPIAPVVLDARVGRRGHPAFPGHDADGWRNPTALAQADVVVLGDSQTYGVGGPPDEAWPRALERQTRRVVYSMAMGGYDPVRSLALFDEVLRKRPRLVLHSVYSGNDAVDAFRTVYGRDIERQLRTSDRELLPEVERLAAPMRAGADSSEAEIEVASRGIGGHVRLVGLFQALPRLIRRWRRASRKCTNTHPIDSAEVRAQSVGPLPAEGAMLLTNCERATRGSVDTLLTSEYRLWGVNRADLRVREGLRVMLDALAEMSRRTRAAGADFVVVFIPTKERVFRAVIADDVAAAAPVYRRLLEDEAELWRLTRDRLDREAIPWIDATEELQGVLRAGRNPYKRDHDGHPVAAGHDAIARAVARAGLPALE